MTLDIYLQISRCHLRSTCWALVKNFNHIWTQPLYSVDLKANSNCWFLHILYYCSNVADRIRQQRKNRRFMRYSGFRLKKCFNLSTNIAEVPTKWCISRNAQMKLIQASKNMLRITLLVLCIFAWNSYLVFYCYFLLSDPVDHGSWDFVVGYCERGPWSWTSVVVRSWGSWIFKVCSIVRFHGCWILNFGSLWDPEDP